MENEIVKIDGLEISKSSVEQVRNEISAKVEEGALDSIKVMAAIKFYEKVFSGDDKKNNGLTHRIKSFVVNEVEKDKLRKDYYGFKVEIKEAGVSYIYDNCNDEVLTSLLEEEKELKEKIKNRQEFLKSIKGHLDIITENGEGKTIFPPAKKSTTSPTFTLK